MPWLIASLIWLACLALTVWAGFRWQKIKGR